MYSPRRRYKRYQSKKYYRNNLFAPSLRKANTPNYYQMKGRIIQQSPSSIKEPPVEIITRKKLDQMYKTLQEYQYKIPGTIDISQYVFYALSPYISFETLGDSFEFNEAYFQTLVNRIPKPPAPSGFHYDFDIFGLIFYALTGDLDESRFNLSWVSDFISINSVNVITKNTNSTFATQRSASSFLTPNSATSVTVYQINFGSSGITPAYNSLNVSSHVMIGEAFYPFVTSNQESYTYGSQFTYSKTVDSLLIANYKIRFQILLYLTHD